VNTTFAIFSGSMPAASRISPSLPAVGWKFGPEPCVDQDQLAAAPHKRDIRL
jgi:hypothetical protein